MKRLIKITGTLLLLIVMAGTSFGIPLSPTYTCVAKNDTLINSKSYQFDVYIYRFGPTDLYLNNYQLSFRISNIGGILNTGVISGSYVAGSSELPAAFVSGGVSVFNLGGTSYFRINGCTASSNGTLIPVTGLKIGTFRLTNTNDFGQMNPDFAWWDSTPGTTYIYAVVPSAPTGPVVEISDMDDHTTQFTDPVLNAPVAAFNVTGSADYCAGSAGLPVGLNGSEAGVNYRLIRNGSPAGANVAGTGSPLSFGSQPPATYTVSGYRKATYLTATMNGSAIVNEVAVTPTISGNASLCEASAGTVYTTEPGMTGYAWSISAGGTITAGGTATDHTATVTWNTAGVQTISVNYTNTMGCSASSATVYNVTVNPSPVAAITGPAAVCANTAGNVYTTGAGNTNYVWSAPGGTITAGGTATSNSATILWNTAGSKTVNVSYTNGCAATTAAVYGVNVNALPVVTIAGNSSACVNTTNIYTTEPGMTGYAWSVSPGGTITAGGTPTNNTVTVTWTTPGTKSVSVNYTNSTGCTASSATVYPVSVNPQPVVTVSGPATVCANSSGNVYTTEPGMTGYAWSVSAGGTVTAGGTATDNTVTVTWSATGPGTVSVNYTNPNGCNTPAAKVYNVTVNPLPAVTILGPTTVCAGTAGHVYTTEPGMTGYTWVVSAGGTITAGGTSTRNTVTVTWNTPGPQTVSVNYTNAGGCSAAAPAVSNVTVNPLPVAAISGPASVCVSTGGNLFSTAAGMTSYVWNVSGGGTITSVGSSSSNSVSVTWSTTGPKSVSASYTNSNGCAGAAATVYNVTVNPLPVVTISGPATVCAATGGHVYTTAAGMSNYAWSVGPGGTITSGGTSADNSVTVTWNSAGSGTVSVNYTNANGCSAAAAAVYNVTVRPVPVVGLNGPATVCVNSAGSVYTTETGYTNYVWAVSPGGTITSGGTSASPTATVTWNTRGAQWISVNYSNGTGGCSAGTPKIFAVNVTAVPDAAGAITGTATVTPGSAQVTYSVVAIPGADSYQWSVPAGATITAGAGTNSVTASFGTTSVNGNISVSGTNSCGNGVASSAPVSVFPVEGRIEIYPVPNDGFFTASIGWPTDELFTIRIYNDSGRLIYEKHDIRVNGTTRQDINIQGAPSGMYVVKFISGTTQIMKKMIIKHQ